MLAHIASLVGLALLLAAPSTATTCGSWTASCGSYYNGSQFAADNFVGSFQFNGLFAGNYTWLRSIFSGCVLADGYCFFLMLSSVLWRACPAH